MTFKNWLEATEKNYEGRKKKMLALATKFFGKPQQVSSLTPDTLDMDWLLPNERELGISWEARNAFSYKEAISISFEQYNDSEKSGKDTDFETGKSLQPGSLDFARQLYSFVKELKALGIAVNYTTWGRREKVYDRWLSKAQFNPIGTQKFGPMRTHWWENEKPQD